MKPKVHESCFVHKTAVIIGDVTIGENCGIWPHSVIRGDEAPITIGDNSNVQDCCVIHVTTDTPTKIGNNVSLGHGCVVHGATIEDNVIVGMKAAVLNKALVGKGSVVAAGAVVKEGAVIPPGSLVAGVPATVKKTLAHAEAERLGAQAEEYHRLALAYLGARRFMPPEGR